MKGISLSSVMQVINLERQSCDIEARADGQSGQLHFRGGTLVDAMADGLAGEDAAYEILAWDHPEFQVNTDDSPRDRTIDADLTQMLLETARRQDEEKAGIVREAGGDAGGFDVADDVADAAGDHADAAVLAGLVAFDAPAATEGPAAPEATEGPAVPPAPPVLELTPEPVSGPAPVASEPADASRPAVTTNAGVAGPQPAPAQAGRGFAAGPGPSADAGTPAAPAAPGGTAAPAETAAPGAARGGTLNVAGLKRVIQIAQDGLDDALVSADVFSTADGTSYVGFNSQPASCALLNQISERMALSFARGGLPPLGRYYMAELADSRILLVAPCGGVQLSLVVDSTRAQLGLILNVILPDVLAALEEVSPR